MDHLNLPNLLNSVGTSQQNSANTSDAEMNFEISENNNNSNPAKKQKMNSSSPDPYTSSPNSTRSESTAPKLAPFIHKMELLIKNNENVFWSEDGKFMVIDGIRSDDFSLELERVGLSNKHESFIRQMNTYGFRKEEYHPSENKQRIKYPNQVFAYFNKNFTRDFKDLHAVHSTGKRKPIQQERETVSQLQKHTTTQNSVINNLRTELENEKMKSQNLQNFVSKIASDKRVDSSVQNEIYRFLASMLQNSNYSDITPPMSVSPQVPQNLAQTLNNQNLQQQQNFQIQQQNMETLQNLQLQSRIQNLQNQLLGNNNIHLLNQPLNISIPDSVSMQPQTVQSTEENQNIQVTENNINNPRVLIQNDTRLQQLLFLASQHNKTNHL